VGDLDDLDTGRVQGVHGRADLLLGKLVRHRVAAVAQGGVGDAYRAECSCGHLLGSVIFFRVALGDDLADLGGGRGHDVQVARVLGQVVTGALDLEEHATLALPRQDSRASSYCGSARRV